MPGLLQRGEPRLEGRPLRTLSVVISLQFGDLSLPRLELRRNLVLCFCVLLEQHAGEFGIGPCAKVVDLFSPTSRKNSKIYRKERFRPSERRWECCSPDGAAHFGGMSRRRPLFARESQVEQVAIVLFRPGAGIHGSRPSSSSPAPHEQIPALDP